MVFNSEKMWVATGSVIPYMRRSSVVFNFEKCGVATGSLILSIADCLK